MSKSCARCEKTVYPTEELKCLDKIWHKICFKCKVCGMTLNMRNYKGMDKEPYCEAHIPKAKATTVAVTPELRRIAENTKIQSNISYHADFEKSKGKFTQVADDPEMQRIKANTRIISNVAYHGDLERKANMESKRSINENGYSSLDATNANVPPPNIPPPQQYATQSQSQSHSQTYHNANVNTQPPQHMHQPQQHHQQPQIGNPHHIGKISDYDPQESYQHQQQAAYPAAGNANSNSQTLIYSSEQGAVNNPPQRHIGSVHDIDPVNNYYGSLSTGQVYRAIYDYEAQDTDEVSFLEGDYIINVQSIDSGWMTGEVERTGKTGMLPANYVQVAKI
ncbi:LIM and SH3 domain protein F42H10.3 [Atheta coriaria]|uniref:LIM and SH3 domain protein F42H10.3 n=1 Tax=Dalotia coriaria TaxID=877792 RepID=UPI0031F45886